MLSWKEDYNPKKLWQTLKIIVISFTADSYRSDNAF